MTDGHNWYQSSLLSPGQRFLLTTLGIPGPRQSTAHLPLPSPPSSAVSHSRKKGKIMIGKLRVDGFLTMKTLHDEETSDTFPRGWLGGMSWLSCCFRLTTIGGSTCQSGFHGERTAARCCHGSRRLTRGSRRSGRAIVTMLRA